MNPSWIRYAENCMWLIVPMLFFNLVLAGRLPRSYQVEIFEQDIPGWIRRGENITRTIVFALPLFMPLTVGTCRQKTGLVLYLTGALLYGLSWAMQISFPGSPWCRSAWGYMAPAYTPLIWLAGIGLIGDTLFFRVAYSPWLYIALSFLFLAFHNIHAWVVYKRNY